MARKVTKPIDSKLNYYKPWVVNIIIDIKTL
jgi:hypothetical protein